jgi:opacity protein-like surface antigen
LGKSSSPDARPPNVVYKLRGKAIMKKKMYVLGVAALVAAMLALSGVAHSAMWVGAELGGNFATGSGNTNLFGVDSSADFGFKPTVIGGATIGYDFVNSGFGAYAWPDWMKYFSFAMDLTYNKLLLNNISNISIGQFNFPNSSARVGVDGYCVAWTFLFMAHYGFMPDSEVPSGRINPYIGVGPAIVWSGFDLGGRNIDATNVALVVEPGIRWVALPNVSIDTAFRWRYCAPSYSINNVNLNVSPLNQFSFLLRANYHF